MKMYYKVWSGLTKFILSQVHGKNRCVDFPLVGKFMKRNNAESKAIFIPHLDFLESGRFRFSDNESNIGPFSNKLSVSLFQLLF